MLRREIYLTKHVLFLHAAASVSVFVSTDEGRRAQEMGKSLQKDC
jgi:hypothetical protein